MNRRALGLIEVKGYLGAIEAADIALKAANVSLIGCEIVKGGLVTVKLEGDVSSVKAAVEAVEIGMIKLDFLVGVHVIARPDTSVWDMIEKNVNTDDKIYEHKKNNEDLLLIESESIEDEFKKNENVNQEEKIQRIKEIEFKDNSLENSTSLREELENKKVNDLRTLARSLSLDNMTKKQIKFAKKDRLVEEIILFYQRRTK
ncbi:BMC domain-containing protein [Clostridium tagluense]|uniref:Ethanolamine utilization protein n=1 Tax=Clostridium tagluense TaxID=360422 RepID=A0A401UGY1_9CLOT|nr:BMC domain-containing protein [Clostridium tagluense]GCD08808.1 ethanolamine utilization protein [Clostridium tagluense]